MKKNTDKKPAKADFPGYPHYDQEEDIMGKSSDVERIDIDPEEAKDNKLPEGTKGERRGRREVDENKNVSDVGPGRGNEADLSSEEKEMLENEGNIKDEMYAPSDLDVPGAELDDEQEDIGSEDEENNYYSLGGDDKENLEENNE